LAQFQNRATLTYNGGTTNSNIVTGEIIEVLSAAKASLSESYGPEGTVTYVVSLVNSGSTAFTDLTVTDDLGAYSYTPEGSETPVTLTPLDYVAGSVRYYVNGVLQTAPAVSTQDGLVFGPLTVPANSDALLIYSASVNAFAPLDVEGTIVNTATVDGSSLSAPILATATLASRTEPFLTIAKGLCPGTVTENGEITYTFTIQNSGLTPADAADALQVTDTFDPILNPITVTFEGQAWTEGSQYTYDETTGLFTTTAGAITVPAATATQNSDGSWTLEPGVAVLTVTGTV